MKRIFKLIVVLAIMLNCCLGVCNAKMGDVIGYALNTDIVAYINHYAINCYAVNGQSVVIAEDLVNYGFDVVWDGKTRSLAISVVPYKQIKSDGSVKSNKAGTKYSEILETDIGVYANGKRITSYSMNGYTMIPIEELTMFGSVMWVDYERAIKLWVEELPVSPVKEEVIIKQTYYETNDYELSSVDGNTGYGVYRTPKGKRYHFDADCGGKNSYAVTLERAKNAGLTPCAKCAR